MNMQREMSNKIDFSNTEIAFSHLSNSELKKSAWLFNMMNKAWIVKYGSPVALLAVRLNLPFARKIVKATIFDQFVGGRTLLECQKSIDRLWAHSTLTVLDYGAEAKETEQDFNNTMNENIRAIEFAALNKSVPVISTKLTGLGRFGLLEQMQNSENLTKEERQEYRIMLKRVDAICSQAAKKGVSVFIDAEESWIQDSIDHIVWIMMERYNKQKVVVYNTFQMYRKDRLQFLFQSFDKAKEEGFMLGAKLVRGAYMNKEAAYAEAHGKENPINPTKEISDDHYNTGIRFCVDNYEQIASCNASHNQRSAELQVELILERGIPKNHPHLNFCQLYGMSDNLTFNLANQGFNVAKYLPYGQVEEVIPYLIRRAQENTSVTGDAGREYALVLKEVKRRDV
jgi:proline dehydrogenase